MSSKKSFWELKLNSITMWRDYPYSYTEKNERAKKASKQRTIEKKRLKLENSI
jgi:hypothetical protein